MHELLADLKTLISSLSINDIIFLVSVLMLLVLIVIMIYLIKLSRKQQGKETADFSEELMSKLTSDIEDDSLPKAEEEPPLIDLKTLTANLSNQDYDIPADKYEKEQEENAIISYDELLKTHSNLKINYSEETKKDGLSVKKVDMNNITSIDEDAPEATINVQLVSYAKEEAFLQALKDLQKLLS